MFQTNSQAEKVSEFMRQIYEKIMSTYNLIHKVSKLNLLIDIILNDIAYDAILAKYGM